MNRTLGIVLGVIALTAFFFWPDQRSDQELIQESLYNIVRGVGDKKNKVVLEEISDTYKDQTGWSKQNIRGILFQQFQQKESFSLQITPRHFAMTQSPVTVEADVVVFGGSMWNPNSDTMEFDVLFYYEKEEDDVWRMTGHTRKEK